VVVYDDLANSELLALCPPATERVYVGKRAGKHCMPQSAISEILVAKAREGKFVVRLKGGDPLIFGRAGEEAEMLSEAGIPYEIVPGVTAASAAGAVAGIPLTQRGAASAVVFVTGHECSGKSANNAVDWRALAKTGATLCIYMGSRRLGIIAGELQAAGMRSDTPIAIVTNATLPNQTLVTGELAAAGELAAMVIGQPALVIIGEVVRSAQLLADTTQRFERLRGTVAPV
jgi:uroporphyrin-III C-methyltransferase